MRNLHNLKIAVIYGGNSKERPGSLVSGKAAYASLKKQGFNVSLIDPQKDNIHTKLKKVDIAFLGLHGRYGEDGKIQGFLETLKIPYTASGVLASALGMDKISFKNLLHSCNIPTLAFFAIKENYKARELDEAIKKLRLPLFIKPVSEGGSLGAGIIYTKTQLQEHLKNGFGEGFDSFILEPYIKGTCLTVGLFEDKGNMTVFPVLETVSKKEFYDYEAKHDPKLHEYYCPARISKQLTKKIGIISQDVFRTINAHGYLRVDFIVNQENEPYVLEVNTLPGLSLGSNLATMAYAAGMTYDDLVIRVLNTAFTKSGYNP